MNEELYKKLITLYVLETVLGELMESSEEDIKLELEMQCDTLEQEINNFSIMINAKNNYSKGKPII